MTVHVDVRVVVGGVRAVRCNEIRDEGDKRGRRELPSVLCVRSFCLRALCVKPPFASEQTLPATAAQNPLPPPPPLPPPLDPPPPEPDELGLDDMVLPAVCESVLMLREKLDARKCP